MFLTPAMKFAKVMFLHLSVSHSVHGGGGVVVSQHALQVSRPTPKGEVEGSGLGGCPDPHPGGGLSWPDTPSRWLLLRAVRILLECILAVNHNGRWKHTSRY